MDRINDGTDLLVSVIIPAYNGPEALGRAIASVLKQTYRNFELLVVDDYSDQPIDAMVGSFTDDRIIYVRHAENKGAAAARNTGMRQARGSLLAFLDSDDEFLPERLARQVEAFQALSEDTGLIVSNLGSPDDQAPYVSSHIPSGYVTDAAFPGSVFSPPSSWMLRKDVADRVGFFDEAIIIIEDADYFVRVLEQARIYYLKDVLGIKYLSFERKGYFLPLHFSGNDRFLKKHLIRMQKDPDYLSRFYYLKGKDLVRSSRPREAGEYFLKAFWIKPDIGYLFKYIQCLFSWRK
jgi:glycosyltransferase involved in cell wall biosynthesis